MNEIEDAWQMGTDKQQNWCCRRSNWFGASRKVDQAAQSQSHVRGTNNR